MGKQYGKWSIRQRILMLTLLTTSWFTLELSAQEEKTGDTLHIKGVEVIGKSHITYPVQVIEQESFSTQAVRDIGDLLRKEANVSGIRKGGIAIDPVIRGFKYNQVTVLLNSGIKIEGGCPNRMDPVASHVESENIHRIEIIKGPYVLKYGPVLGAMINMETEKPRPFEKPGIHGEVLFGFESNWNGQREHIALTGGNDKVFFNLSAGYKDYGNYKAGNDVQYNTSFNKIYGTGAVGFLISKNHQMILSYAFDKGTDVMYPALPMDEKIDKTHIASINYTGKNVGIWEEVEIQGYFTPVHHVMDNLNRPTAKTMQAVTSVDAWNAGGKINGTLQKGAHKLHTGFDFEHIYKDGEKLITMQMEMDGVVYTSIKRSNVWLNADVNNAGMFAEYNYPFKGMDFTAAVRMDYNQAASADTFQLVKNGIKYFDELNSEFVLLSFGIGIKKTINERLSFKTAIGRGTRSPSVLERFIKLMPVQYDSFDYLGNPQLKPEKNHQLDASIDYIFPSLGTITVGGFFSAINDYIIGKAIPPSVIKPSTMGSPGVKQFMNTDLVYLTGFETSFQSHSEKKLGIQATIAVTYGTEPEAVKYIISQGQVVGEEKIKNDPLPEIPPLEGSLHLSYKLFQSKLIPRVSIRMVSPQNRISNSYGEIKTPGFTTADLSFHFKPWKVATIGAGVNNIFNTSYYEHLNRRMVGSLDRFYEPGRVFYFTVNLQI